MNWKVFAEWKVEIPDAPEDILIADILDTLKRCQRDPQAQWSYDNLEGNKSRVANGVKRLIENVQTKNRDVVAIPRVDEEIEMFYANLEKLLKHIAFKLKESPIEECIAVIEFLGYGGNNCAIRHQQEVFNAYYLLYPEADGQGAQGQLKKFIKNLLYQSYEEFLKGMKVDRTDPHKPQRWMRLIGADLGLPGAELVQYEDGIFAGETGLPPKEWALAMFFKFFFRDVKLINAISGHTNNPKARPKLTEVVGELWNEKLTLEWAREMTSEKFEKEVAFHAKKLKLKRNRVAAVLAERLRSILNEEIGEENYDWLREIKTMKVSKETRNRIHDALRVIIADRVNDKILDEDTCTTVTVPAIEELLYDLGIFK